MKHLIVFALLLVSTASTSAQTDEKDPCDHQLSAEKIVGVWHRYLTNDPEKPPSKFTFERDGTFRCWDSNGRLYDHKWQGHWAVIKNRLYMIYNNQTCRQYLYEDEGQIIRISKKYTMRRMHSESKPTPVD